MRAVGLVEVLTALGALFKKRTGAFVAGFSFCKRGLRAARVRRGRLQPGFEGRGIDLVEHVARLHFGAFREGDLLEDAAHLGLDLDFAAALGLAEQRDPAGLVCRFNGQGFNRKGSADGLWGRRLFAAGEKRERQKAGANKTECMSHVVEGGLFLACVSVWPRSRREANVFG